MADRALIILTSHAELGDTGNKTGFYWEELAAPYYALVDHGLEVDLASVAGGEPPADPGSAKDDAMTDDVRRFLADDAAMKALKNTVAVDTVKADAYRIVYVPGGHGVMWDLSQTPAVGKLVANAFDNGSVVGAVCHGPAGLLDVTLANGDALVKGRRVSGFTNSEEQAVGLEDVVPYLLETRLRDLGADYVKGDDFTVHAVRDGRLVTGQNPPSSAKVAQLMIEALEKDAG